MYTCENSNVSEVHMQIIILQPFPQNSNILGEQTQVEPKKFGILANWQRRFTMEDILVELKREMAAPHNRKLPQPPEGTFF